MNHILADHNAHIRVEDNLPAGARFTVEIPVDADAAEEARDRRERDSRHARMKPARILVVDDEPGIRQSLCGVLEDEGYHARAVASGEECLEDLTREPSELVLLDVWLPGIDGLETLARIQEIPFADRPVVVMISGHGNIETAVKATKLGAFDFLEKPLSIEKLAVVFEERAGAPPACSSKTCGCAATRNRNTASSATACP